MNTINIAVIIGSNRKTRVTPRLAKWIAKQIEEITDVKAEIIDLAEYNLPLFDEELPPQANPERQLGENTKRWLEDLGRADGFVVVSPEYNRSIPGVLKNALDLVDYQMRRKPVLLASHGSTGGTQAVVVLRSVIGGLKAVSLPDPLTYTGRVAEDIDEQGNLADRITSQEKGPHKAIVPRVEELVWYSRALCNARQ